MYTISVDPTGALMTVRMSGFWDEKTFRAYAAEVAGCTKRLLATGRFRSLLIDMSDFPIQSQAQAEMHGKLLRAGQERHGFRTAIVMRSALSRLQASRVARLTGSQLFDDVESALASLSA